MGSFVVVVIKIFPDDVPKLLLAGKDEVVETLALEAADEGLHVAVVLGRLGRYELGLATDGFQNVRDGVDRLQPRVRSPPCGGSLHPRLSL